MVSQGSEIGVGFLGFGPVGHDAYRMLKENRDAIERKVGIPFAIHHIGGPGVKREVLQAEASTISDDYESVVDDPMVEVVIDLTGDEASLPLIERALAHGKHVVTADKILIANHGARLVTLAREKGLDLHYEGAVGGGIPLIQPLKHQLAGNDVIGLVGILNSTTNYMLTAMHERKIDFETALGEAQRECFTEADPAEDIDGLDTRYKLAILASVAFHHHVPVEGIACEGIRNISLTDIRYAEKLGYVFRLLGIAEAAGEGIYARVCPALVSRDHPLANVTGVYNALYINGDFVGDVMLSGRGTGPEPIASAVIGDLVDIGRNLVAAGSGSAIPYDQNSLHILPYGETRAAYYLRLIVQDRPRVLGMLALAFGDAGVGLAEMEMTTLDKGQGEIVFLTHECRREDLDRALAEMTPDHGLNRVVNVFEVIW